MSDHARLDEKYYQVVRPGSLSERLLIKARNGIYRDFMAFMRPASTDRILDVGVSDVVSDGANLIERLYPHPQCITAVGLGDGQDFIASFPQISYRQIEPHAALPFADGAFDVACANAVLEHVGSPENQHAFVADMLRVAQRVFLTVPHRFFPIEHHTALPLAGWTDATFRIACGATRKAEWADPQNLILMSRSRLAATCPPGRKGRIGYTGLRLGPLSSNLFLSFEA
jgi:SAM-dependent methyltransferase